MSKCHGLGEHRICQKLIRSQGADYIFNRDLQNDVHSTFKVKAKVDLSLFTVLVGVLFKQYIIYHFTFHRIQVGSFNTDIAVGHFPGITLHLL